MPPRTTAAPTDSPLSVAAGLPLLVAPLLWTWLARKLPQMGATEAQIRTTYPLPRIQSSLGQLEVIDNDLFSRNLLPTKKEPQSGKAEKGEERTRSKIAAVRIHVR